MNTNTIALIDLNSGETVDLAGKLPTTKFLQRGHKMYNNGVIALVDILTKTEMKKTILLFDRSSIDYNNILIKSFFELTSDMSKAARSRFKHKLLDNNILQEYNNKLMLNPYIFVPRNDKNIPNSQYLTQRAWNYMFVDATSYTDAVYEHAKLLFGELLEPDNLLVGTGKFKKSIPTPKGVKDAK